MLHFIEPDEFDFIDAKRSDLKGYTKDKIVCMFLAVPQMSHSSQIVSIRNHI